VYPVRGERVENDADGTSMSRRWILCLRRSKRVMKEEVRLMMKVPRPVGWPWIVE
jgi:hypothetical protein